MNVADAGATAVGAEGEPRPAVAAAPLPLALLPRLANDVLVQLRVVGLLVLSRTEKVRVGGALEVDRPTGGACVEVEETVAERDGADAVPLPLPLLLPPPVPPLLLLAACRASNPSSPAMSESAVSRVVNKRSFMMA